MELFCSIRFRVSKWLTGCSDRRSKPGPEERAVTLPLKVGSGLEDALESLAQVCWRNRWRHDNNKPVLILKNVLRDLGLEIAPEDVWNVHKSLARKICRYQRDSNSDRRSTWGSQWPLNQRQGAWRKRNNERYQVMSKRKSPSWTHFYFSLLLNSKYENVTLNNNISSFRNTQNYP